LLNATGSGVTFARTFGSSTALSLEEIKTKRIKAKDVTPNLIGVMKLLQIKGVNIRRVGRMSLFANR
jgi:hypothetical protein